MDQRRAGSGSNAGLQLVKGRNSEGSVDMNKDTMNFILRARDSSKKEGPKMGGLMVPLSRRQHVPRRHGLSLRNRLILWTKDKSSGIPNPAYSATSYRQTYGPLRRQFVSRIFGGGDSDAVSEMLHRWEVKVM